MTAVVTALYGGCDRLQPQVEQDIEVEWFAFTDDPDLTPPAPWQVVVEPARFEHPNLAAKVFKCCPDVGHGDVIWNDASMQVTSRSFAREALAARRDGIAAWRHPRRDCIYAEAKASLGAEGQGGKYAGLPIMEQVAHYRAEGHPRHGGLYACGTVAWDRSRPSVVLFGAAWLEECVRWTYQDQLSFPVVARRFGVRPGTFPLPQIKARRRSWIENRWLLIHEHVPRP